jgi:hypothetical protein
MKQVYAVLLFLSFQSFGQDYAKQTSFSQRTESEAGRPYEITIKNANGYEPGYLNNIPAAVYASFLKDYEGAVNISWMLTDKQSTVYCNWQTELIIVKYNNDGTPLFTRKTYTIDKLDRPFTDFLKREFDDKYEVNYITEFVRNDKNDYEISMSNKSAWMMVRITRDKASGSLQITSKQLFNSYDNKDQ